MVEFDSILQPFHAVIYWWQELYILKQHLIDHTKDIQLIWNFHDLNLASEVGINSVRSGARSTTLTDQCKVPNQFLL